MSKLVCEICEERTEILLINHHIQSRSKGGIDHPSNIACLCRSCHEHVHHGLIIIEGRFNSNVGNIVVYRKWNEPYVIKENTPEVWLYPDAKIYQLGHKDKNSVKKYDQKEYNNIVQNIIENVIWKKTDLLPVGEIEFQTSIEDPYDREMNFDLKILLPSGGSTTVGVRLVNTLTYFPNQSIRTRTKNGSRKTEFFKDVGKDETRTTFVLYIQIDYDKKKVVGFILMRTELRRDVLRLIDIDRLSEVEETNDDSSTYIWLANSTIQKLFPERYKTDVVAIRNENYPMKNSTLKLEKIMIDSKKTTQFAFV